MKNKYTVILIFLCNLFIVDNIRSQIDLSKYDAVLDEDRIADVKIKLDSLSSISDLKERGLAYTELSRNQRFHSVKLTGEILELALEDFKRNGNDSLYHVFLGTKTWDLMSLREKDKTIEILDTVHAYWQVKQDPYHLAATYKKYGWHHQLYGNYPEALDNYYKSIELYKRSGKIGNNLPDMYNRVGILFNSIGNHQASYDVLESTLNKIADGEFQDRFKKTITANLLNAMVEIKPLEEVVPVRDSVINFYLSYSSYKFQIYGWYYTFDKHFENKDCKQASIAMKNYREMAEKFDEVGMKLDGEIISYQYYNLCSSPSSALPYLSIAEKMLEGFEDNHSKLEIYETYDEHYRNENNYKKAYSYKAAADSIRDIILSEEKLAYISQLEIDRIKRNAKNEIDTLMLDFNKNVDRLKKEKVQKYILGGIAFVLFMIGLWIYRLYQSRNKFSQELESSNTELKKSLDENKYLIKEIHHRVKNNLQVVSSLLGLQKYYENDERIIQALNTGKERVQSISILHKTLYGQEDLSTVKVKLYFEDLVTHLVHTYHQDETDLKLTKEFDNFNLDIDTLIPLGLIVNELVTNAFKYGLNNHNNPTLLVSIKKIENIIWLEISDNGPGIGFTEIPERPKSLGMQLVKSFSEKIEADINIDINNGTTFTISVPLEKNPVRIHMIA